MKKPQSYDTINAGGFVPVTPGGHTCVIKNVREQMSKSGKQMIVVALDFVATDSQPRYFAKLFSNDVRPEKKWPTAGTKYVMVEAYNSDDCSKDFKGFCAATEESNKNFTINWDAQDWGEQFKGKQIGAVYGMVQNEYNGKISMRSELRWFIPASRVATAKVPEPKMLKGYDSAPQPAFGAGVSISDEAPF